MDLTIAGEAVRSNHAARSQDKSKPPDIHSAHELREASWSAAALCRFSTDSPVGMWFIFVIQFQIISFKSINGPDDRRRSSPFKPCCAVAGQIKTSGHT